MPRKPCYWTRKLELELVNFVKEREFIWKPTGNTNHHIEQKYRAYAEFATQLGRGFTARSVRDRWVNIRSTFNHNLRKVEKTKETAKTSEDIYVPCWPLWKPLQFLREVYKKDNDYLNIGLALQPEPYTETIKDEANTYIETELNLRQRFRPPPKDKHKAHKSKNKCKQVIDDLLKAMAPLAEQSNGHSYEPYWFFGRHVTERLNAMRESDAECASQEILNVLDSVSNEEI